MNFMPILYDLRLQDVLDIVFLTVVAYHLYQWFRGTKALKALVGLLVLGIVYTMARTWGLFLTTWAFEILWQVLVILLIILFQSEIRQVLERVNPLQAFGLRRISRPETWIPEFVKSVFSMAERRIGSLVIIERMDRVGEFITEGQSLEGDPSYQLLLSIFQKDSPLHDGAVLIRGGRLNQVACYLPLSSSEGLPREWGTRHRAALGLSERCDALVVVVSEERGEVSVALGGKIVPVTTPDALTKAVLEAMMPVSPQKKSWWEKARFLMVHRWREKVGTLFLVSILWLLLAGQQNFEVTFRAPVEIRNIPARMEVLAPLHPTVQITVRGLRKDASSLNKTNVTAAIDLSMAQLGRRTFSLGRDQIRLPNDRVSVVNIQPTQFEFRFGEIPRSTKDLKEGQ